MGYGTTIPTAGTCGRQRKRGSSFARHLRRPPTAARYSIPSLVDPDGDPGVSITAGTVGEMSGTVCTKGITAQLWPDGPQWGAAIAFNLNGWETFDATTSFPGGKIVGFSLDVGGTASVDGLPYFALTAQDQPPTYRSFPVPAQGVELLFRDFIPGPLSKIQGFAIGVGAAPAGPTPFDYCISNLRVLQDSTPPL